MEKNMRCELNTRRSFVHSFIAFLDAYSVPRSILIGVDPSVKRIGKKSPLLCKAYFLVKKTGSKINKKTL